MLVSSVHLGDLAAMLLFAGVMIALFGVFLIALVRLLAYEVTRASARAEMQGQPAPATVRASLGLRLRWETALFVTGVVGFLGTLSTATQPGLSVPTIVSGLMVLIGAGLFVACG